MFTAEIARFLCRFLRSVAKRERARVLQVGLVQTHVHLLLTADPQTDWPLLIQRLKGGSSCEARKAGYSSAEGGLWDSGYNLETVGPRQVEVVRRYLRMQPERHSDEAIPDWTGDTATYEQLR